jgi:hypothetical protein
VELEASSHSLATLVFRLYRSETILYPFLPRKHIQTFLEKLKPLSEKELNEITKHVSEQ